MKPSAKSQAPRRAPIPLILSVLLLLPILLALSSASANDSKKSSASPGASPSPSAPKFNIPIPVKHDAEGVKLPYYDNHGRLQMYFNITKAIRLDLGHLEMKNAYMQTYDDKGTPDANVFMSRSVLDLNTRVVTSDVPVVVRRSDFQIVGQNMVFSTQTRRGQMSGHVRMTIYNRQATAQPTPAPASHPSSKPASTPSPSSSPQ